MSVRVHFVTSDGKSQEVEAKEGRSLMETARDAAIPGIVAECGGACACATCHVHVDAAWIGEVGPPTEPEMQMLDFSTNVCERSRLACQVELKGDLDGLVVHVPDSQY